MYIAHDVWIYFGDMSLSAMIVVIGMVLLFIVLMCYWLWKFYRYLKQRAEDEEMRKYEENQRDPLLDNFVSDNSNNRYIVL